MSSVINSSEAPQLNTEIVELLSEYPKVIEDFQQLLITVQWVIEKEQKALVSDDPDLPVKVANSDSSYLTKLEIQSTFLSILLASRIQQLQPDVLSIVSQVLPVDFDAQAVFNNPMLTRCNHLTTLALVENTKMPINEPVEETEPGSLTKDFSPRTDVVRPLMESLTVLSVADLSALLLFVQKNSGTSEGKQSFKHSHSESGTGQLNDGNAIADESPPLSSILDPAPNVSSNLGRSPASSSQSILGTPSTSDFTECTSVLGDPPPSSSILGNPPSSSCHDNGPSLSNHNTLSSTLGDPPVTTSILGDPPISASILGSPPVSSSILGDPPVSSSIFGDPQVSGSILDDSPVSAVILADTPVSAGILCDPSVKSDIAVTTSILGEPPTSLSVLGDPPVPLSILGEPPSLSSILGNPPVPWSILPKPSSLLNLTTPPSSSKSILGDPSYLLGNRSSSSPCLESSLSLIPPPSMANTAATSITCASPIFSALVNFLIEQQLCVQTLMRRRLEPRPVINLLDLPLLSPVTPNLIARESGMMGPPSLMGAGPFNYYGRPSGPIISLMDVPVFNRCTPNFTGSNGLFPQSFMSGGDGILGSGDGILGSPPAFNSSNEFKSDAKKTVEVLGVRKPMEVLGGKKVEVFGFRKPSGGGSSSGAWNSRIPDLVDGSRVKQDTSGRGAEMWQRGRSRDESGATKHGNRSTGRNDDNYQSWSRATTSWQGSDYSTGNQTYQYGDNKSESILGPAPGSHLQDNTSVGSYGAYGEYYGDQSSLQPQPPAQSNKATTGNLHTGSGTTNSSQSAWQESAQQWASSAALSGGDSSSYNYQTYGYDTTFQVGNNSQSNGNSALPQSLNGTTDLGYSGNSNQATYDSTSNQWSGGSNYDVNSGYNYGATVAQQGTAGSGNSNYSYVGSVAQLAAPDGTAAPYYENYNMSVTVNYNASTLNNVGVQQPTIDHSGGSTSYGWNTGSYDQAGYQQQPQEYANSYYQHNNISDNQVAGNQSVVAPTGGYHEQAYAAQPVPAMQDAAYSYYGAANYTVPSSTDTGGANKRTYEMQQQGQVASYSAAFSPVPGKLARFG